MNKKILILGNGYIGSRLHEATGFEVVDKKISSFSDAEGIIKVYKPNILINCIGYTGRNVDECEKEKDRTLSANTFTPLILAEAALREGVKLVHISSGCIYHYDYLKNIPISEDVIPDFLDLYYSRAKIYTELALSVLSKKFPVLIVRIRVPLDCRPSQKNLLTKLIEYKKAIDIPNSVTYIPDFIDALKHLISMGAEGIYNVVNKNPLSYPELLDVYKKFVPEFNYERIDFSRLNITRTNLILSTNKLEHSGFKVRDIHDILEECVREYTKF